MCPGANVLYPNIDRPMTASPLDRPVLAYTGALLLQRTRLWPEVCFCVYLTGSQSAPRMRGTDGNALTSQQQRAMIADRCFYVLWRCSVFDLFRRKTLVVPIDERMIEWAINTNRPANNNTSVIRRMVADDLVNKTIFSLQTLKIAAQNIVDPPC